MTIEYVVIKSRVPAARTILKNVAVKTEGDLHIVPYSEWVKTAVELATTVMTDKQHDTWKALQYVGPTEQGVWLSGANALDVTLCGGVPVWRGRYVHVSEAVYSQLRSKYSVWWVKAKECRGWSHDIPDKADWQPANEPNPAEMKKYIALVYKYFSVPTPSPAGYAEIERLSIRCDRDLKLFTLASAKASK